MANNAELLDNGVGASLQGAAGFLEAAFEDALQRAADHDLLGETHEDPEEILAGLPRTNVERVQESLDFYREHMDAMDAAVRGAMDFLQTTNGAAYVKALEGSFHSEEFNPLSLDIATGILGSEEFSSLKSSNNLDDLQAFGIGASAGASFFVGALAGAEALLEFKPQVDAHGRAWYGLSFKSGISLSLGLEFSWWFDKPVSGLIRGWLVDLWVPYPEFPVIFYIRFMHIKQRPEGATEFIYAGSSIQVPLGIGLPVRKKKEKYPGLAAGFWAKQIAWSRTKRASLSVVNNDTGASSIVYDTPTTLQLTLKNTFGDNIDVSDDATITINMPNYFSTGEGGDVSKMSITPGSGWTFSNDNNRMKLTATSGFTWGPDKTLTFTIDGVTCSNQPNSTDGQIGTVTVDFDTKVSRTLPIVVSTEFDLVWQNSEAAICWTVTLDSSDFAFSDGELSKGTKTIYALPGTSIEELTTVYNISDPTEIWTLGYVFNYNTVTGSAIPEICAAWYKQNSPKIGNNVEYSTFISEDGSTTCYYAGLSSTGSSITITAAFNSTTPPSC